MLRIVAQALNGQGLAKNRQRFLYYHHLESSDRTTEFIRKFPFVLRPVFHGEVAQDNVQGIPQSDNPAALPTNKKMTCSEESKLLPLGKSAVRARWD